MMEAPGSAAKKSAGLLRGPGFLRSGGQDAQFQESQGTNIQWRCGQPDLYGRIHWQWDLRERTRFLFFRKPDKIGEFIIIKGIAETQPEEGYRQLKLICYDFVKALATHTEIVVNIGLGNAKAGVEGIAQSYREGLRVCQKTSFSDKYQVAAYDSYKKGYVENVFSDYEEIFKKSLVGDSGSKALEVVQLIYHKIQMIISILSGSFIKISADGSVLLKNVCSPEVRL